MEILLNWLKKVGRKLKLKIKNKNSQTVFNAWLFSSLLVLEKVENIQISTSRFSF